MKSIVDVLTTASIKGQTDWVQGNAYGVKGGGCLVGLLMIGADLHRDGSLNSSEAIQLATAAATLVAQTAGLTWGSDNLNMGYLSVSSALAAWNDNPERRHQDVLDLLGAAREIAEASCQNQLQIA